MGKVFKILLVVLAVFPLWLTIIAFGGDESSLTPWKARLNEALLKVHNPKVQITSILSNRANGKLTDKLLKEPVKIDLININPRGTSQLGLRYFDKKGRLTNLIYLNVHLFVQRQVSVATQDLPKGSSISKDDFKMKWMDASTLGRNPAEKSQIENREVRSFIGNGDVIYTAKVKTETLINKGDRVKVKVVGKGLSVSTIGVAQEDGTKGETIKILNLDSKREIYAVVIGAKRAEVRL